MNNNLVSWFIEHMLAALFLLQKKKQLRIKMCKAELNLGFSSL